MKNTEHRKNYRRIWMRRKRGIMDEALPPPPPRPVVQKEIPKKTVGKYDHLIEEEFFP